MTQFYTSESASEGHPDKLCDLIADRILDVCLGHDQFTRCACEVMVTAGTILVTGTLISEYEPDIVQIVSSVLAQVGYDPTCFVVQNMLRRQGENPAEDSGVVIGYACEESPEFLPLPVVLAHRAAGTFSQMRKSGVLMGFCPNAQTQITVEYDEDGQPFRLEHVVLSACSSLAEDEACWLLSDRVLYPALQTLPPDDDAKIQIHVNADPGWKHTGMTGHKVAVDTYGSMVPYGSSAFSGKGPSNVKRSGAYMARYIAKNLVAAQLAERCQVTLFYAVGMPEPMMVQVDTFGTGKICADDCLADAVRLVFGLTLPEIITQLDLRTPRYTQTAVYGHFGKPGLPWERIDRVQELRSAVV